MPRAEEMIEKVDTRDHAPATDAADLTIAAVHPDSFWRDQAEQRRADDNSDAHLTPRDRVEQGEGEPARASQSEAAHEAGDGLSGLAGRAADVNGDVPVGQSAGNSGPDQDAPAAQAPNTADAGLGPSDDTAPAVTQAEAGAQIPPAASAPEVADVEPPLAADIGALPIPGLAPVISGGLDTLDNATGAVTDVVSDVLDTAASPLTLATSVVEPVASELAPGLLNSLFQPEATDSLEAADLDLGDLQPLDGGAVDNLAEDATSLLPLAGSDSLLGGGEQGTPADGLFDL